MKAKKYIISLCILIVAASAMQSVSAAILPYSTYGSENGWAGYKDYKEDNFDIRVYFNVYDISLNQFFWEGENPIPEGDKYIYVYKIYNRGDETNNNISTFSLQYADGSTIPQHLIHNTSAQNDYDGGIAPDPDGTTNQGEWVWSTENGYIEAGQHSWLLVFTSDHAPVKGKFTVEEGENGDFPVVPEPATIILFGSAAGWILTGRNNKRKLS